jgi:hypothetical protein
MISFLSRKMLGGGPVAALLRRYATGMTGNLLCGAAAIKRLDTN